MPMELPRIPAQTDRDRLRAHAQRPASAKDHACVSWEGEEYEVRAPSLKFLDAMEDQIAIRDKKGRLLRKDHGKGSALLIINCTYVPGRADRVWDKADLEWMIERPMVPGSLLQVLSEAISSLVKVKASEVEEDFDDAPNS